jgi:hypothetical protein
MTNEQMKEAFKKILEKQSNHDLYWDTATVISAFPRTGKTVYFQRSKFKKVLDSDSSKFDKQYFPENYIEHIKASLNDRSISKIFVSSHKTVREALVKHNIAFTLIYPRRELKEEYIERYKQRGNTPEFIALVDKNWDSWIDELDNQEECDKITLKAGEFIGDVLA